MISTTTKQKKLKRDFAKKNKKIVVKCENTQKNEQLSRRAQAKLPDVFNISLFNQRLRETKFSNKNSETDNI